MRAWCGGRECKAEEESVGVSGVEESGESVVVIGVERDCSRDLERYFDL